MEFLKKYWVCILIIIMAGVIVFLSLRKTSVYADQIDAKNDSIEALNDQYQIIQIQFENSQDLFVDSENDILFYQDSLNKERTIVTRNRKYYETAIIDLISIPSDSLYLEVTRWLDSR